MIPPVVGKPRVNKRVTTTMNVNDYIRHRKSFLRDKIKRDTSIILNHYAIAKEICDPKKSIEEQSKCSDTMHTIESMLIVVSELEKELKLLDSDK
jgi:hypothetical protein